MTGCPTCGTALEQARSLVHPEIESTLLHPRGSWSCSGCLGVVVEEEDGEVGARVPGGMVIRAIEHLRRARDDGRLPEEAARFAQDPMLWFAGRVPEVFSLFGWKSVERGSVVDRVFAYVPNVRRDFSADGQSIVVDPFRGESPERGSLHRAFDGLDLLPESVSPATDWERMTGYVDDRMVLRILDVSAPAILLDANDVFNRRPWDSKITGFWVYADALIPYFGA